MSRSTPTLTRSLAGRHQAQRHGISVILCTYQGVDRITRALESLVTQTLGTEHFEVVVVQNGPSDGTSDLVKSFSATHPTLQIRIIEVVRASILECA